MDLNLSKKIADYNLPDTIIKKLHKKSIITLQDFITHVSEYTAWKYRCGYLFPTPPNCKKYSEDLRTIKYTEHSLGIIFTNEEYKLLWDVLNLKYINQIYIKDIDIHHVNIIDYFADWDDFSKCGVSYVRIDELDIIKHKRIPRCSTVQDVCDQYFIPLYKCICEYNFESSAIEMLCAFKQMKKSEFFKDRYFKLSRTRIGKQLKQTDYPYNLFSDMMGFHITQQDVEKVSKNHLIIKYINNIVMCKKYNRKINIAEIENRYQYKNIFPLSRKSNVNDYISYIDNEVDKLKEYLEYIEGGELFNGFYSN